MSDQPPFCGLTPCTYPHCQTTFGLCCRFGIPGEPGHDLVHIRKTQEQTITEAAFDALAKKMHLTNAAKLEKRDRDLWDAFVINVCHRSYKS